MSCSYAQTERTTVLYTKPEVVVFLDVIAAIRGNGKPGHCFESITAQRNGTVAAYEADE